MSDEPIFSVLTSKSSSYICCTPGTGSNPCGCDKWGNAQGWQVTNLNNPEVYTNEQCPNADATIGQCLCDNVYNGVQYTGPFRVDSSSIVPLCSPCGTTTFTCSFNEEYSSYSWVYNSIQGCNSCSFPWSPDQLVIYPDSANYYSFYGYYQLTACDETTVNTTATAVAFCCSDCG